jgi:hypothetical protein
MELMRVNNTLEVNPAIYPGCSLLNLNRHPSKTTAKYTEFDDLELVEILNERGWSITDYKQTKPHNQEDAPYVPYLATFTHPDYNESGNNFTILQRSARDGTRCLQIDAGLLRAVCANGLVVGQNMFPTYKLKHKGEVRGDLTRVLQNLVEERVPLVYENVKEMRSLNLTSTQQRDFAHDSLVLRFGEEGAKEVDVNNVLKVQREADRSGDLFTTFNVVQEHLVKGRTFMKRTDKGKLRKVKALTNISKSMDLNKGMWDLAESYIH